MKGLGVRRRQCMMKEHRLALRICSISLDSHIDTLNSGCRIPVSLSLLAFQAVLRSRSGRNAVQSVSEELQALEPHRVCPAILREKGVVIKLAPALQFISVRGRHYGLYTMDQIAALNASHGQEIPTILVPTFKIFTPGLLKNESIIRSVNATTEKYGPHPRHELDVFPSTTNASSAPILIFFHGGGLIRGDKKSPNANGLVYANLASFFAQRGITTINPNYRLVNSEFGGHDAVFPSGGEDVGLVLKWVEEEYVTEGTRDVYILGNSAGGVHISTFLLAPDFLQQRKSLTSGSGKVTLKGAIELAVPLHFHSATPERSPMLKAYYGNEKDVEEKCAYGLLEKLKGSKRTDVGIPKTLALVGEFDPVNEIVTPMNEFVELWKSVFGDGIEYETIKGHNHISPPWSLLTGDERAEVWAENVAEWIKK